MEWGCSRRSIAAALRVLRPGRLLAAACAVALAGCNRDGQTVSAGQPRGATVAFESVDGLPPMQFQKLVKDLNDEAQARRLAVISREQSSAYRVRGYLAAKVMKQQTTISWVWDVFDQDERRALRISGEETVKVRHRDAWAAADDAMLRRIARASMEQLGALLTSPEVAPGTPTPASEVQVALVGSAGSSPEAAGIFRIFQAHADPMRPAADETASAEGEIARPVPLPRRRPTAVMSANETLTLAASRR